MNTDQSQGRTLVVLGMHRSHTSFLASWLHSMGLFLGERLMPPDPIGNPKGYFEDLEIVSLHDEILETNNTDALSIVPENLSIPEEIRQQVRELVTSRTSAHKQWGWKDPRTCLFFNDLWKKELENPFIIVTYRHYADVVSSLTNRENNIEHLKWMRSNRHLSETAFSRFFRYYPAKLGHLRHLRLESSQLRSDSLSMWLQYNRRCIECIESLGRDNAMVIRLEDLLANSIDIYEKMSKQWNFGLNYKDPSELLSGRPNPRTNHRVQSNEADNLWIELNNLNYFL